MVMQEYMLYCSYSVVAVLYYVIQIINDKKGNSFKLHPLTLLTFLFLITIYLDIMHCTLMHWQAWNLLIFHLTLLIFKIWCTGFILDHICKSVYLYCIVFPLLSPSCKPSLFFLISLNYTYKGWWENHCSCSTSFTQIVNFPSSLLQTSIFRKS